MDDTLTFVLGRVFYQGKWHWRLEKAFATEHEAIEYARLLKKTRGSGDVKVKRSPLERTSGGKGQ